MPSLQSPPNGADAPRRCPKCGAGIYGAASWCTQCFAPLGVPSAAAPRTNPSSMPEVSLAAAGTGTLLPPPSARAVAPFREHPLQAGVADRHAADWGSPDSGPADSRAVDEGVARTAAAIIGLNVLLQVGVYVWSRATHVEPATGIRIALYLAAGFYGLSYALIASRVKRLDLRPAWIRPGTARHAQLGLTVGVGAWLAVIGLGFLATH